MPIARGIMQFGRVNVYPTICEITNITPTDGYCGLDTTFSVSVINTSPGLTVNGGTFDIIDTNTSTIIASGNISAGTGTTSGVTNLSESLNLKARYNGLNDSFSSSLSSSIPYNISIVYTQTLIVTPDAEQYYCYHEPLTIIAQVSPAITFPSPPVLVGNVQFIFNQAGEDPIIIGQSPLDESGIATIDMPADTGVEGSGSIVAYYLGQGCFDGSYYSTRVISKSNDPTSIALGSTTAGTLYTYTPINLTAVITATDLPNPSDGEVHFSVTSGAVTIDLGNYSVSSGTSSTTIPPGTLTPGIWTAVADYIPSSTECYLGSGPATRRLVIH